MKVNPSWMISKAKETLNMNQRELGDKLFLNQRQLSRLEKGEKEMEFREFIAIAELLGLPSEDYWVTFLDMAGYEDYLAYKKLKRCLRNERFKEARTEIDKLEKSKSGLMPFIKQYIAYAKVYVNKDRPTEEALSILYEALHGSLPNFEIDKISEYRLTYHEICIIILIASIQSDFKNYAEATRIYESIIASREKINASEEEKAMFFPSLFFNLSNQYGKTEEYKKALRHCYSALDISLEYDNLRLIPKILHNMACCHLMMKEEKQIYQPLMIRAYHTARAFGDSKTAEIIKKDAEENFDILDL